MMHIQPEFVLRTILTKNNSVFRSVLFWFCFWTFEERELLEEPGSHKGVSKTQEKPTEQLPCGADVERMRSGTHKTHRHLQESKKE